MIKLLIGGSPCTFWSIAQTKNRETEAEGMGWELFKNYLVAKEKFKPDFFLYENNKSAAKAIKDQIKHELKVYDGTMFDEDSGARYIEINSALVSAQNRQRFYVHNCGDVQQPEDRGILLKDVLDSAVALRDKAHAMIASVGRTTEREYFIKNQGNMCAEPINTTQDGKGYALTSGFRHGVSESQVEHAITKERESMVAEPININKTLEKAIHKIDDKLGYVPEMFNAYNSAEITDKSPTLSTGSMVTSSCAVCIFENVIPNTPVKEATAKGYTEIEFDDDGIPTKAIGKDGKSYTVYEVKDGKITIKGKQYPTKLIDGYYIIRKMTVKEYCRLQTMPDDYCRAVSDSQAYKGLGNGWTAEVIIHILSGALKDVPRDDEIVVLSMYDGIGTGRYCLDKMGFTNVKYYAYEIDKYAKQIAMSNYPDIIHMGDAFKLRDPDWTIGY